MPDLPAALRALAERGSWVHQPCDDPQRFLAALRAEAAERGLRVNAGVSSGGLLWACTEDGLPGEEPWRGAEEYAEAAGVNDAIILGELDRLLGPGDRP